MRLLGFIDTCRLPVAIKEHLSYIYHQNPNQLLKKVLICIVTILPHFLSAQDNRAVYKNQIKFSPFRLVDLCDPGIELSYERLYSKRFSTQVSGSYDIDFFGMFAFHAFHGYRLSVEEKYFPESTGTHRKYISLDLVRNNNHYNNELQYMDTTTHEIKSDGFTIYRKTFSINLKYGKQIVLNRFIIDWCAGIGIKQRNVTDNGRTHIYPRAKGTNLLGELEEPGKSTTLNLPINIKIGYIF